jgi:hypothetical protein
LILKYKIKFFIELAEIMIGMKEWLDPQISLHCPINKPGRLIIPIILEIRPGIASILIPMEGTLQE